jgi:hypothetical protein
VTITYPAWYKGGNTDIEMLVSSLFTPLIGGVEVVSWLPDANTYNAQLSSGGGYLRTYRVGGRFNFDQNRDETRAQIAALTRSRDESWYMIEFVRQTLFAFAFGANVPGTGVRLTMAGEVIGPQQIPELIQDDRLVPITVELHTARPKGLPNYRASLGL